MDKDDLAPKINKTPASVLREHLTFGQRAADRTTNLLGSWLFIIAFGVMLMVWISLNSLAWILHWDPYPFILLNLALSCLAALQAPIIMMSQKRQEERDRITAKYDYAINRKAEREIQNIQKDLQEIKILVKSTRQTPKTNK
ncbi:MAG: DUF1003 domain-containing protein [Candidatus Magasanikbacteria bacterium]|nr:DUF1003 domain-containing protein [Candidatus Magasanikbacteria bacterium]